MRLRGPSGRADGSPYLGEELVIFRKMRVGSGSGVGDPDAIVRIGDQKSAEAGPMRFIEKLSAEVAVPIAFASFVTNCRLAS